MEKGKKGKVQVTRCKGQGKRNRESGFATLHRDKSAPRNSQPAPRNPNLAPGDPQPATRNPHPAIFLDRDGTINMDKGGYINHPDDFELFPFAGEAISILNKPGYLVFVVSNQSGITRGYYTAEDLEKIHQKMEKQLQRCGAKIDEIFFSPYHIEGKIEPYNIHHEDRKPGLGMFKKALKKYRFDVKRSFMIGDRYSDIVFGKKAGLTTILLLTGFGKDIFYNDRKKWEYQPDYVVKDLLVAAKLIEKLGI